MQRVIPYTYSLLFYQARRGGAVVLYLVANAVDVLLALGLSYLCFSVWKV